MVNENYSLIYWSTTVGINLYSTWDSGSNVNLYQEWYSHIIKLYFDND